MVERYRRGQVIRYRPQHQQVDIKELTFKEYERLGADGAYEFALSHDVDPFDFADWLDEWRKARKGAENMLSGMTKHQLKETVSDFRKKYPKLAQASEAEVVQAIVDVISGRGLPARLVPVVRLRSHRDAFSRPIDPKFQRWLDQFPPGEMPPIPEFLKRNQEPARRRRVA